ncbi:hypothetical protein QBC33DRAFT_255043 [Phialemonium atrogriseum]|uniref:Secreted protein n=1 Tax=Phialemonium atrogriseum TaxID=1093897 RepID=A0AAJ0FH26_9PEZI|nr:uncharacterized protein QBC33DRAFT_255043 [Phialemonium atrogriseum]KAK1762958.1 hypothetical protein QBC33DRAFT_255043 [Phialemonium atrogriseum]
MEMCLLLLLVPRKALSTPEIHIARVNLPGSLDIKPKCYMQHIHLSVYVTVYVSKNTARRRPSTQPSIHSSYAYKEYKQPFQS